GRRALEEYVGARDERSREILRRLALQIERDALLARVVPPVVEAAVGIGLVAGERTAPAARAPVQGLDLYDARTPIREQLARPLVAAVGKLDHREALVHCAHLLSCRTDRIDRDLSAAKHTPRRAALRTGALAAWTPEPSVVRLAGPRQDDNASR